MQPLYLTDDVFHNSLFKLFPATGLCSPFVRAKMLYRRLVDDVVEIFVLLHTSFFSCSITARVLWLQQFTVAKLFFDYGVD